MMISNKEEKILEVKSYYDSMLRKIKLLEGLPNSKKIERQLLLLEIDEAIDVLYPEIKRQNSLRLEFLSISKSVSLQFNANLKWLERAAIIYFSEYFLSQKKYITDISFFPKLDGDQIGRKMRIQYFYNDSKSEIFYFVKTHQNGSRKNGSTIIPVDPKELFFYKLLELTHFGPKAHFFLNPLTIGGYFIATQDEGFSKTANKIKFFHTYGYLRDTLKENSDDIMRNAILTAHLLQRIFHLWDIVTNPGNYGQVKIGENIRKKWRIIDFRVMTLDNYNDDGIAERFLAGNDMDGYVGALQSITKDLSQEELLLTTNDVLGNFELGKLSFHKKMRNFPLLEAIPKAFCYIARLLKSQENTGCLGFPLTDIIGKLYDADIEKISDMEMIEKLNMFSSEDSGDLGRYIKATSANFRKFSEDIKSISNTRQVSHWFPQGVSGEVKQNLGKNEVLMPPKTPLPNGR